jgi:hypothetical protein
MSVTKVSQLLLPESGRVPVHEVLLVDLRKVIINGLLRQLDEARDALSL